MITLLPMYLTSSYLGSTVRAGCRKPILSIISEASIQLHVSIGEAMCQDCSSVGGAESQGYESVNGASCGRVSQATFAASSNFLLSIISMLLPCIRCLRADIDSM